MGRKSLQSSHNGETVPLNTLWYEPLRGKIGLATSTPWLKFGEIGRQSQRNAPIVSQLVNKNKKAELHTIINSAKPDIILGNEPWFTLITQKVSLTPLVHSLIQTMEYASSVWDPYTNTNIKKLEMIQRRVARFVKGDYMAGQAAL